MTKYTILYGGNKMIITTNPEVIDYIEKFKAIKASNPLSETELSVTEQKILYTIIEMFDMDDIFRSYITLIFRDYSKKRIAYKEEELIKILIKIADFVFALNKKGE